MRVHRVKQAISAMFVRAGLDPGYGMKRLEKLQEEGFMVEQTRSVVHLTTEMSPIANAMAESAFVLRAEYTGTGLASDGNIDGYVDEARNRLRRMVCYSTGSVLARAQ